MRVEVVTSTGDPAVVAHDEVVAGDSVELGDDTGVVLRAGPGGAWVEFEDGGLEEVAWDDLKLVVHPEDPRVEGQVPLRALTLEAGAPRGPRAGARRGAASGGPGS